MVAKGWRGGPLELYLDERQGVQTGASREVGDEDELAAHGPDGDGSLLLAGGDGETLVPDDGDRGRDDDTDENDDTDDFWMSRSVLSRHR